MTTALPLAERAAMLRRAESRRRTQEAQRLPHGLKLSPQQRFDGGDALRMLRALDVQPDDGLALVARGDRRLHPFRTLYPPPRSRRVVTLGPKVGPDLCLLAPDARLADALADVRAQLDRLPRTAGGNTRTRLRNQVRRFESACLLLQGRTDWPEPVRPKALPEPQPHAVRRIVQADYWPCPLRPTFTEYMAAVRSLNE